MSNVSDQLLDAAEARIRKGGFHAVSFRDIAGDLGIKSASVHYHFPKKEDLGAAVVARYGDRFFADLETRVSRGEAKLPAFIATYKDALTAANRHCLCGIMAAETRGLPEPVSRAVAEFLSHNVEWLEAAFNEAHMANPRAQALHTVAAMQGAMLLSVNLGGVRAFEAVAGEVLAAVRARARG